MRNYSFMLDGTDSLECGIRMQAPLEIGAAKPIYEKIQIPGRNGTLIFDTGAFENRKAKARCFALSLDNVINKINEINRFLLSAKGYRRLETPEDSAHFMLAKVSNSAKISQRMLKLAQFEIEFDCKPQRFFKSGEAEITVRSGDTLSNPYGFPASPLLQIDGAGSGSITIGEKTIQILNLESNLTIDCETMNAFQGIHNKNADIKAYEFPILEAGENEISFFGGITSLKIVPRWWEV